MKTIELDKRVYFYRKFVFKANVTISVVEKVKSGFPYDTVLAALLFIIMN